MCFGSHGPRGPYAPTAYGSMSLWAFGPMPLGHCALKPTAPRPLKPYFRLGSSDLVSPDLCPLSCGSSDLGSSALGPYGLGSSALRSSDVRRLNLGSCGRLT